MVTPGRKYMRFQERGTGTTDFCATTSKGMRRRSPVAIELETIIPRTRNVAVVMLDGANQKKAGSAIRRLEGERKDLVFTEVSDPKKMPKDTELMMVFANGTTEGAGRFLAATRGKIATMLVREHEEHSGEFDYEDHLSNVETNVDRLLIGMNVAFKEGRGEFLVPLIPIYHFPAPAKRAN